MPIYEFYCRENNKIYQFYAKTLAQGRTMPRCPDNPKLKLEKIVSQFAVTGRGGEEAGNQDALNGGGEIGGMAGDPVEDARMEAAMGVMEQEFSSVNENDPRAMGRMMRRMAEVTGEKIDGEMEEVVRKLEEGANPDSLEEQLGSSEENVSDPYGDGPPISAPPKSPKEPRARLKAKRRPPPTRDPKLYDYE